MLEDLKEIKCPTLMIRGEKEGALLSKEDASVMAKNLVQGELATFPNSGHTPKSIDQEHYLGLLHVFFNKIDYVSALGYH